MESFLEYPIMKELMKWAEENPPDWEKWLPVHIVLANLKETKKGPEYGELSFDLIWTREEEKPPSSLSLTIKDRDKTILSASVSLDPLPDKELDRYPEREIIRTSPVMLTQRQFARIWNYPDLFIIFSHQGREAIIPYYL